VTSALAIFPVERRAPQVAALRQLAARWSAGDEGFWAADDVLAALERPGVRAWATAAQPTSPTWQGFAMVDVTLFGADLLYVYVDAAARRQALGARLLAFVLETLSESTGLESLTLEVRPSNAAALALYARLGFAPVGRRQRYYRNGDDALVLQAALPWSGPAAGAPVG
jgi:ribosomal-protein-alanine N-acetyltransferase